MKRFLTIAILLLAAVVTRAQNVVSLNSPTGYPGDTVEVVLSLEATDNCVAMQARIPLGENMRYVAGSAQLNASRISDHDLTAQVLRDTLLIYSYSLSLTPYSGTGELVSFRLVLRNEPGSYPLMADDVILSDASYNPLAVQTSSGTLTVLASKIALSTSSIDYGHYPIRAEYTRSVTVQNTGNVALTVSGITFDDTTLSCNEHDVEIVGGSSSVFTLRYNPVRAGSISRRATVHSSARVGDSVITIVADPFAVNELHVENASGYSDSIITVYLRMNNMDSIVGVQTSLKLPSALTYIEGSFAVAGERSQGHLAAAGMSGDTLTMIIYNTQNKPLTGPDGVIASFQVRLFGYGYYYLTPIKTVLSDTNEFNGVSAVYSGRVQIYSPYLQCGNTLDMGRTALPEPVMRPLPLRNSGNATLIVNQVVFNQDHYSITDSLPLVLQANGRDTLHVVYDGLQEGSYSCTMSIYSNDANNTMKNVTVGGSRYEPNAFYAQTEDYYFPEEEVTVSFMLENYSDITAVQFDYSYPHGNYTLEQSDIALTSRANGQSLSAVRLNDSTYRVLIFSMQNNPFTGHEGAIATARLHPIDTTVLGEYRNRIATAVVSNIAGDNKLTDLTESDLFVTHPHCTDSVAQRNTVCQGETVVFYGVSLVESGVYEHRVVGDQCDTLYMLSLTVNPSYAVVQEESICDGSSYSFDGNDLTAEGVYTQNATTTEGCDSTVVLSLSVVDVYHTTDSVVACDSYEWVNGVTYDEDGSTAVYETTSAAGCDSIVTLRLTLHQSASVIDERTVCDSLQWIDGQVYRTDNNTAYYVTQTTEGCDSVVTLSLTVNHSVATTDAHEGCDSYMWLDGVTYTESVSDATYQLTAANGCDSTLTLSLTLHYSQSVADTAEAATEYQWYGTTYTESGDYEWSGNTADGCDSTATLHLTITGEEGIEAIGRETAKIMVSGTTVTIEGTGDELVTVCDMMGRVHYSGRYMAPINLHAAGIYMIKIGTRKVQKIICR